MSYKRLCREHAILERSFATLCQSLRQLVDTNHTNHENDIKGMISSNVGDAANHCNSQRPKQQKICNKQQLNELNRQIQLLTLELQESNDQNELLEFKLHEFQVNEEITCNKCFELEIQLLDVNNENQKLKEILNVSEKTLNELIVKYAIKEELNNLLLNNNFNQNNVLHQNTYNTSAMTSEDEGLGDDTRRDHSSGPSSLTDLQEREDDMISQKFSDTSLEFGHIVIEDNKNIDIPNDNCAESDQLCHKQSQHQMPLLFQDDHKLRSDNNNTNDLIDKLKQTIDELKLEKTNLEEQVLELEEAENDSRLLSQRLRQQMDSFKNKDKRVEQYVSADDNLFGILWQKLYRLEAQVDCLKEYTVNLTTHTNDSNDSDDGLQLFISDEKLSEGVSKIGSSFQVSHFDDNQLQTNGNHWDVRLDNLIESMPLCETVKPERIDVSLSTTGNLKMKYSSAHHLTPEIKNEILKLETNEHQLRERLVQLEWINKEFVSELELREKIFFERENIQKDWMNCEKQFIQSISELKSEIKSLEFQDIEMKALRQSLDEKISMIFLKRCIEKLETQEYDLKSQLNLFNCEDNVQHNSVIDLKDKYDIINKELDTERDCLSKINEDFSMKTISLFNCHNYYETLLKQQLQELEVQQKNVIKKLTDICHKKILLVNSLKDEQNECLKARQRYEEQLDVLLEEHKVVEKELRLKMQQMETQTVSTVNQLENERNDILKQLDQSLNQIKSKEFEFIANIEELNTKVDDLENKILDLMNNKRDLKELEIEKMKLKSEITSIQMNEEELKRQLNEMMRKESAYSETLTKADNIIATLELNYKQRIHQLESSETKYKIKALQLEESESRLRSALKPDRRTTDSYGKASDLVKQLIDCEARESSLKLQIKSLELSINQLQHQLDESNNCKNAIEKELKDQDQLVQQINHLLQQTDQLKHQLNNSLQSQQSLQDLLKDKEIIITDNVSNDWLEKSQTNLSKTGSHSSQRYTTDSNESIEKILVNEDILKNIENCNTNEVLVKCFNLDKSVTIIVKSLTNCQQSCDEKLVENEVKYITKEIGFSDDLSDCDSDIIETTHL
ncbi:putative leucine-rich repeat-containing protein DDB_G0290503 [Oppia nitens]|uniref:putative leucine-rich repeat-containing protein DDB_G0290503 n=1 Tax=Oppia nitens TaxID=1686743 RepID=UPI0023DBF06F|nr:putative leucine-rich repeat-containing protein DDB_G0290503 [Oppia nitens]